MELDPQARQTLDRLHAAGWSVVVTSAGCDWYIKILLERAGLDLPVFANPGRFEEGRGLIMELPRGGPFFSPTLGIDKAEVVRQGLAEGRPVAFAGDGFPDLAAARLVPDLYRFACADLATALGAEDLPFRTFDRWSDIAQVLCDSPGPSAAKSGALGSTSIP
jgi:2-hydroxy-3-keto-5-methylthiopentenyl-1-phosphate phosphatase